MATLDIIIGSVIGLGILMGLVRGFIKQLATLLGLVVGLLAAKALHASLALKLAPVLGENSLTYAQILAFVLIWLAVPLVFTWIAFLLTKAMEVISLGWLNRLLGAGMGALKATLLLSLLFSVIEVLDTGHTWVSPAQQRQSVLYEPIKSFAEMFFPVVKSAWEDVNI